MIDILNVRNFNEENYDEAWLTVRAVKHPVEGTKYVPTLSPSWELFCRYRELVNKGHRSILAGLLQGVGCNVKTEHGTDYSIYYKMLMELQGSHDLQLKGGSEESIGE